MRLSSSTSSSSGAKRLAISLLSFIALAIALDRVGGAVAEYLFMKTVDGDTGGQINGLLRSEADVVVFGSSRAESHYVPGILADVLQTSVFNAGFKGSNAIYDYGVERLVLETYQPRVLIFDFSSFTVAKEPSDPYDKLYPLYPFWRHRDMLALFSEGRPLTRLFFQSRLYPYNSKLHSIAIFSIIDHRPRADHGYVPQGSVMGDRPLGAVHDPSGGYDERIVNYIEKCLDLAHRSGAKVIFVQSPRYATGSYTIPESVQGKLNDMNIPVIDFSTEAYPQFSDHRLYRDVSHLNHTGAQLFSALLAERIKGMSGR